MKKQTGFTLIELVIVVVILGFLAVTAIPKFLDLTDQAKEANIEGMAGGFATAVSLVRAQWEAEGRPVDGTSRNIVEYDGTEVLLTTEDDANNVRPGYVVATTGGVNAGAGLGGGFTVANCIEIWQNILQQPPGISSNVADLNGASGGQFNYLAAFSGGTDDGAVCQYYLKETLPQTGGSYTNPGFDVSATAVGNSFTYQPSNSSVVVYVNN
ncbi:type II secretion system protein [Thalassotalea sp. M1531]|uniref:Type II secretion system protein n=1 Tax=Thalassotalea algicola TaxID=2716224 RepID=A0A7Y0LCI9_9GAMM|nr:type II secretion system protein [Thalassotalea algicola]NMP31931.1 type II secretion system protein [Thalassotalea algicola]